MLSIGLVLLLFFQCSSAFKFLVYSPQFASSHVNFFGKLADSLAERGHEVVMLAPQMDQSVKGSGTRDARVISLPQCTKCKRFEELMNGVLVKKIWTYTSLLELFEGMDDPMDAWINQCNETLRTPGLIDQLTAEKFDAAFGESTDPCFGGLVHMIGVDKYAITDSVAINDQSFAISHTPTNFAYIPGFMASGTDVMTFSERFINSLMHVMGRFTREKFLVHFQKLFQEFDPDFPSIGELIALNSLYFVNSEPLLDFPKITSARVIDIGGIVVSNGAKPLNKTWSDILDLRSRTILISFGSFAKSYLMPVRFRENIREVFRRFPDKPEDRISEGINNLIETTWMPRNDLINDPRLSAFVTHCGQGSTTESSYAGIPLIVIPLGIDQLRNAQQIKKNGLGVMMNRDDLSTVEPFQIAVEEILENENYSIRAKQVQQMLLERPFSMKEIFVRNMEFLASHGPLRQLDHYGRHLNFFQYYLIDVIGAILLVLFTLLTILLFLLRCFARKLISFAKQKTD